MPIDETINQDVADPLYWVDRADAALDAYARSALRYD